MQPSLARSVGVLAVAITSLVVVGAPPGAASAGLTGKSAQQVVAISVAAAKAKGSAHFAEAGRFGGPSGRITLDQSRAEGKEVDSGFSNGTDVTLLFIKGVLYLDATARSLTNAGFSAAQASAYAGKWISFSPGDKEYAALSANETLVSTLDAASPSAPLSKPVSARFDGRPVIKIVGAINPALAPGLKGTDIVYVSAAPPYLPVAVVIKGAAGSGFDVTTTVSGWGERVSLSPPAQATPAASILGS